MLRRCLLAMMAAWLGAGLARAEERTDWAALFIDGQKSGHAKFVRTVEDGVVTHTQQMTISLPRLGTALEVQTATTTRETEAGEPLGFEVKQKLADQPKTVSGRIEEGKVRVTVTNAGRRSERTIDWPEGALMNEGARLLMERKGLEPGTQYSFKQFVPDNLAAFDVEVTVGQTEQVDLLGRVAELTRVETAMDMHGWTVKAVSWVDADLNALLMEMPVMFAKIKLVACPKAYALSPNEPGQFFESLMTKVPSAPPEAGLREGLVWRLRPRGEQQELKLPETAEQSVQKAPDGVVSVTVRPAEMPAGVARPYEGDDPAARAALEPSDWLQSEAALIRKLSARAVDGADDAAEAARRVEQFVHGHIEDKDLSVGYASALEVARSRQGDCTEHAVLAAALCKAAGVPARVTVGLAYADGYAGRGRVLVPHAWTQVYLDGAWYSLDAALEGFDAGHILLATGQGEPVDFMAAAMTLGGLRVESVSEAD